MKACHQIWPGRRQVSTLLVAVAFAAQFLCTEAFCDSPENNQGESNENKQNTSLKTRLAGDFLWLLKLDDKYDGVRKFYDGVFKNLADSKVPTEAAAHKVAMKWRLESGQGLLRATESRTVIGLIKCGADVPAFANRGDLIWIIRFSESRIFGGLTNQELWISSTTAKVRAIFPWIKQNVGSSK